MDSNKDYYAILGVLPTAESVVIRAAYKALAQRYHPDRYEGGSEDDAHRRMAEINEAYEVLSNPENRKKYDELRGSKVHDASSFFDETANGENGFYDPLSKEWAIAVDFYPDLLPLERELSKVSFRLAYTFKAYLIESKQFDDRKSIASAMERQFLELYFGVNESILGFARGLISRGEKEAAKALNSAIRVLGPKADPNAVIARITDKYQLNYHTNQQDLINAVWDGNWATAKKLLEDGVNPGGLQDKKGRSLIDMALERGDHQMAKLLKSYGAN